MVLSRTRLAGEKINIGGLELNTLKKLNGLKLTFPLESIVLANAVKVFWDLNSANLDF